MSFSERIFQKLNDIKTANRFRFVKEPSGIDFCSNDYLGLAINQDTINYLKEGITIYGGGSTASRLIRGHRDIFSTLEENFSNWVNSESTLFLANGFLANIGLLDAIKDKSTKIFCDRLNHASILDGIRLSNCETRYFKHLDLKNLEELLKKTSPDDEKIIISETIFSMDGDTANIEGLIRLKKKYNCTLVLDEAHALGVYGREGAGLSNTGNIDPYNDIDFRIFTGGKSLGLEGAFISCSQLNKDFLINTLRSFIFTTAPLPAIAYALNKLIPIIKNMNSERELIYKLSDKLRLFFKENDYSTGNSSTHIIPVILNDELITMNLAGKLQANGYDIRGIRPPTVKESRLRINVSANIEENHIDSLCSKFLELV